MLEEVDVPYADPDGVGRTCGHDLHMAVWSGARACCTSFGRAGRDVVFMFQPAEEGPVVQPMVAEDCSTSWAPGRRPLRAARLLCGLPARPVGVEAGNDRAAADEVKVRVLGVGGHGSTPHRAKDPIPAQRDGAGLQTMVTAML